MIYTRAVTILALLASSCYGFDDKASSCHDLLIDSNANDSSSLNSVYFSPNNECQLNEMDHFTVHFSDGPSWTFQKAEAMETLLHHFVGTMNDGDTIHLLNYNGLLTGTMILEEQGLVYQFRPNYLGNNTVQLRNVQDFSDRDGDDDEDVGFDENYRRLRQRQRDAAIVLPSISPRQLQRSITLNVMIVWTTKAECLNSREYIECQVNEQTSQNMQALVDLSIAETNAALTSSGANVQLNLVHSFREPSYDENDDMGLALFHLANKVEGQLDYIHGLREHYNAHFVSMIMHTTQRFCGRGNLGYPNPGKWSLFSVVQWDCAAGYYSLAHEIGHNFGCEHDRGSLQRCDWDFSHYGYRDPNGSYRDIMSTYCNINDCDQVSRNGNCVRKQFFSADAISETYGVMGDERNNCVGQINAVAEQIAAFFPEQGGPPPTLAPTPSPTRKPTRAPTRKPTPSPTRKPTRAPTRKPTPSPTKRPTRAPTRKPTPSPTRKPTRAPTRKPTRAPTRKPTKAPTVSPTKRPTKQPTPSPTKQPTPSPTKSPTRPPTKHPTSSPSRSPTRSPVSVRTPVPTKSPTKLPTKVPTPLSTTSPTRIPTRNPTESPTVQACGDGICEVGESCLNCPLDCASGIISSAVCGNGICEAGNGEHHFNCPYDCRGGVNENSVYFCGVGRNCGNPECNKGQYSCSSKPVEVYESCCGDGMCTLGESSQTCDIDCIA